MLYSGKEKRYESHYMAPDWGPSRKSSCPLYTKIKFIIFSSQTHHHLASPSSSKSKPSAPAAQGSSRGVSPDAAPPCPRCPSSSVPPARHTSRVSVSSPPTSFPLPWTSHGFRLTKTMLTCPLPFHLSPPLFFSPLHVIIRMAVKANVTVSLPRSKFLSYLYIHTV